MSASPSTLTARAVGEDGRIGALLGISTAGSAGLVHQGSNVIAAMVGRMAANGKRSERQAFDLLVNEAWSNGKVWIGAEDSS